MYMQTARHLFVFTCLFIRKVNWCSFRQLISLVFKVLPIRTTALFGKLHNSKVKDFRCCVVDHSSSILDVRHNFINKSSSFCGVWLARKSLACIEEKVNNKKMRLRWVKLQPGWLSHRRSDVNWGLRETSLHSHRPTTVAFMTLINIISLVRKRLHSQRQANRLHHSTVYQCRRLDRCYCAVTWPFISRIQQLLTNTLYAKVAKRVYKFKKFRNNKAFISSICDLRMI